MSKKLGRPKGETRKRITGLVLPATLRAVERLSKTRKISLGKAMDELLSGEPAANASEDRKAQLQAWANPVRA